MQVSNFTNQFLIAMPSLRDPHFSQTVTYICAHNDDGAMGLVINRPANCELGEILEQMQMKPENETIEKLPVYQGGPIHTDRGFVLHEPGSQWDSSISVSDSLGVTTSRDILHAIAGKRRAAKLPDRPGLRRLVSRAIGRGNKGKRLA